MKHGNEDISSRYRFHFISSRYICWSGISGSNSSSILVFWRIFILFFTVAAPVYISSNSSPGLFFSISLPILDVFVFLLILMLTEYLLYLWKVKVLVAQLCLTLCNPVDYKPPGSSVHEILQARILKWVAIPSSGDLPDPGIELRVPALQADSLPPEPPGKPIIFMYQLFML